MRTALLHHPLCSRHRMQRHHPEAPERVERVLAHLDRCGLAADMARRCDANAAADEDLLRVHPPEHLALLRRLEPDAEGLKAVDGDTFLGHGSLEAARHATGTVLTALDGIMADDYRRAFCAVRPPGHHAETRLAMGFCFFNSAAVAARRAMEVHGLERVAILDFDVHHGNGTVEIFQDDPRVLVCSSFQHPFYPDRMWDVRRENLVMTPLAAGTGGSDFRRALERDWLPALERHRPQLILISAGFDAHRDDPLGELRLTEDDFAWATRLITAAANDHADGRVLSLLEGGYDLDALCYSAEAHVAALAEH